MINRLKGWISSRYVTRLLLYFAVIGLVVALSSTAINAMAGDEETMLGITELGIGTAIIYNLYKPLAENNIENVLFLYNIQGIDEDLGIYRIK